MQLEGNLETNIYEIEVDMLNMTENPLKRAFNNNQFWAPFFEPDAYWKESDKHILADNVLQKRRLKYFGERVTIWRQHFVDEAHKAIQESGDNIDDSLK